MPDVFISYASADRDRVAPIVEHLQSLGWDVWWDRAIEPGDSWTAEIEAKLQRARCVVVIWSPNSINSTWVRIEANKARERNVLIPVNMGNVLVPPEFGPYQSIMLYRNNKAEALTSIGKSVRRLITAGNRRRIGLLAFVATVIVAAGLSLSCTFTNTCTMTEPQDDRSLAVLPFTSEVEDRTIGEVAGAFVDELRDGLAGTAQQPVASRRATESLPADLSLGKIGDRLGVQWLISGNLRASGNILSISVEIVDADTGYMKASRDYRVALEALAMEKHIIIRDILGILGETDVPEQLPTDNPRQGEAYLLYLTAKALVREQHDEPRLQEAERLYSLALALLPDYALAEAGLCNLNLWRFDLSRDDTDFQRASEHCDRALDLGSGAIDVHIALGELSLYKGHYQRAQTLFSRALELDAYSAEAHIGLAKVNAASGDTLVAESHYRAAINSQPGFWRGYNELGIHLIQSDAALYANEANKLFSRTIELSPADSAALSNLGVSYIVSGQLEPAVDALTRSLSLSNDASANANLGSVYFWLGNFDAAARYYQQAVNLLPENYQLWANLADAQDQLLSVNAGPAYAEARNLIKKEIELNAQNQEARIGLAAIEAALENTEQAFNILREETPYIGNNPNFAYTAAVAYSRLDKTAEALKWMTHAAEQGFPAFIIESDPAFAKLREQNQYARINQTDITP